MSAYFLPYQLRWINDDSALKLYEKSRRVGITYATSFRCVRKCLREPADSSFVQWVASRDELTAKEFVTDYVAMWAREANKISRALAEEMKSVTGLDGTNIEVVDEKHGITAFVVRFRNGARICSLSSNPKAFAGKGGDILIDEMDLHPDQETLYAMAYPCITWGGQLEAVSAYSPDGSEGTMFARICREAAAGTSQHFSFHRTTLDDAIAEGFVEKVNETKQRKGQPEQSREEFRDMIRTGCGNLSAFETQYMCIPNSASGQQAINPSDLLAAKKSYDILRLHLIGNAGPLDLADPSVEPYTRESFWKTWGAGLPPGSGLSIGWDIAVTGDLACIWINAILAGNIYRLAACLTFKTCKIESQRRVMEAILDTFPNAVAAGDASGLGTSDCDKLEVLYYGRFTAVKFTAPQKLAMYTTLQGVYEARRQEIPILNPEISADISAMKKIASPGGHLIFSAGKNELLPDSHCDLMTAGTLAVYAAENAESGPVKMSPAFPRNINADYHNFNNPKRLKHEIQNRSWHC